MSTLREFQQLCAPIKTTCAAASRHSFIADTCTVTKDRPASDTPLLPTAMKLNPNMKYPLVMLCLTLAATQAAVVEQFSSVSRAADHTLMKFMLEGRTLQQANPQRSLSCFDHYVPVLNAITEQYEADYAACLQVADNARGSVDAATQPQRERIEASAADSCSTLHACTEHANSIDYFHCFSTEGSTNAKRMYAISANASEILNEVREQYRLVDNEQNRCTAASERAYVENTADTYEELQSCLQGKTPVPSTVAPSTSTDAPVEATTGPVTEGQ